MNTRSIARIFALGFAIVFFSAAPAFADVYGKIRGTVSDSTGAVIAGAKVTATNVATDISTSVTSSSDGSYQFLELAAPAIYSVKAELAGFKTFTTHDLSLSLDQIYVLNVKLEVGTVTQQVTVEANPAQVETTSIQLGATLNAGQVTSLPLNGRNWVQLQQTLPGVVAASDRFGNNFSTNGSRSQANNFLVNGTDANDLPLNSPLVIPSPDAIAEVSVVTNTINPEFGRNGGAVLNATTKSGSNRIHGDGFEFYRDTSLNTRNFFNPSSTIFHQNQFGGTVGGPIVKDKAFFFFSYQGTRNVEPEPGSVNTATVFTTAQRAGNFGAGNFDCSIDTTMGQTPANCASSPFPLLGDSASPCPASAGVQCPKGTTYGNVFDQTGALVQKGLWSTGSVPTADFNSVAQNLMTKYIPLPNLGANGYSFNPVQPSIVDQYLGRVDYNLSPSDTLWAYFFIQPQSNTQTLPFTGATVPGFGDENTEHTYQYTLNWTHTFGGATVNEARIGYQRLNFAAVQPITPALPSSFGFTGINPQDTAGAGAPLVTIVGGPTLGFSNNGPQPRIDQTYQLTDNLSKVMGRHTTKFGINFLFGQVSNPFNGNNNGNFTFGGGGSFSTTNPIADFLLGIPDGYLQGSGGFIDARTRTLYSYAQDQFKFRPNLTLTYGVGWEIDTPIHNLQNGGVGVNCFIPGQQSTVFSGAPSGLDFPGDPGCNNAGGPTTKFNHFAPRLGFAYSPGNSGKWSFRGGFGIYYNRTEEELSLQNLGAVPFSVNSAGAADSGASPSFANPFTSISTGTAFPNKFPFVLPTKGSNPNFSLYEPFSMNVIDPKLTVPYSMNYNLTIERQLSTTTVLTASYVGLQGRHLTNAVELNPAGSEAGNPVCVATPGCNEFNNFITAPQSFRYPQTANGALIFASVGQQGSFINSNFNAVQVSVDKKMSHGLSFRASYGWGHSLDGSSSFEDLGFSGVRGLDPFNTGANYGDSAFDARQRFVASYVYQIPTRWRSGFAGKVTDGWNVSGITTFQTGFPITVGNSNDRSYTCDESFEYYSCWARPNVVSPVATYNIRTQQISNSLNGTRSVVATRDHYYFNPNAFQNETLGTLGNAGRNFSHGPGINNFDFALHKDTRITESTHLELRFEFFNLFNHAQFNGLSSSSGGPNSNSASSNFGRDLSATPAGINSRLIQLAAKIIF